MASHESTYRPSDPLRQMAGRAAANRARDVCAVRRFPDTEEPQLLLDNGRLAHVLPCRADHDRRRAGHALCANGRRRLQQHRAHPPRCELRLADPQPARGRQLDVLPRRLHPHRPRALLWILQGPARSAVDPRRCHLPADDGYGLHGLFAALGADELLGRNGDHQFVLLGRFHHSGSRHQNRAVAVGRLFGVGNDTDALL